MTGDKMEMEVPNHRSTLCQVFSLAWPEFRELARRLGCGEPLLGTVRGIGGRSGQTARLGRVLAARPTGTGRGRRYHTGHLRRLAVYHGIRQVLGNRQTDPRPDPEWMWRLLDFAEATDLPSVAVWWNGDTWSVTGSHAVDELQLRSGMFLSLPVPTRAEIAREYRTMLLEKERG